MIKAVFWFNSQHQIVKFSINGHAEYDEMGNDIVCAATSALVISTVNGLTDIVGVPVDCSTLEDIMIVELQNVSSKQEKAQVLLETLHLGLSELSKEYPDNLEVISITLS